MRWQVARWHPRDSAGHAGAVLVALFAVLGTAAAIAFLLTSRLSTVDDADLRTQPAVEDPFAGSGEPATYEGHAYSSSVLRPTAGTAQSKLWFADGTWWGLLVNPGDDAVHIYELVDTHVWRDTGTVVDPRPGSRGDALWNESAQQVVVASRADQASVEATRFSYDSDDRSWSLDAGFPQSVDTQGRGPESVSVDQDSTGRLWLTYTLTGTVFVSSSGPDGTGFSPGVPLPGADTDVSRDDISAVVSFDADGKGDGDDSIGVLWSDQESDAFRFAVHRDGEPESAWSVETALSGPDIADDHLSLKTMPGPAGDVVLAAVKTSLDTMTTAQPDATLVGVLARRPPESGQSGGRWSLVPAGTVAAAHSRPLLLVDAENKQLIFMATARPVGTDVYLKRTSFSDLRFPDGRGEPFVVHGPPVQDVSGTKQPVTADSGVVVLVSARGEHGYVHAESGLGFGAGR